MHITRRNQRIAQRCRTASDSGSGTFALGADNITVFRLMQPAVAADADAAHMKGAHCRRITGHRRTLAGHQRQAVLPEGNVGSSAAHIKRDAVNFGSTKRLYAQHRCRRTGKHSLHRLLQGCLKRQRTAVRFQNMYRSADAALCQSTFHAPAEAGEKLINLRGKIGRIAAAHKVQLTAQLAAQKHLAVAAFFQLMLRLIFQLRVTHGKLAAHSAHTAALAPQQLLMPAPIDISRNLATMVHITRQIVRCYRQMSLDVHARSGDNCQKRRRQAALGQSVGHDSAGYYHTLQLLRHSRLQHRIQRRQHTLQHIIMRRRALGLRHYLALPQHHSIRKGSAYINT